MAFRIESDDRGPLSDINITPLVDVMLVLLVIFMVTAPMMESGIAVQLPKANAKALPKDDVPLTVSLAKGNRIYVGKDEVAFSDLKKRLATLLKKKEKREVFIRADGSLMYAFVAQTMAIAKIAGAEKLGLVTVPPEESQK